MNQHLLTGSCLCNRVKYSVAAELQRFYLCHCEQCRKVTGSAFASNIQSAPAEVKWLSGAEYVKRFDYPGDRFFTKVLLGVRVGFTVSQQKWQEAIYPSGLSRF
jgi:hypothetical protein